MYSKNDVLNNADELANKIKNLKMIQSYQNIESQIHENQSIETKMKQLKLYQKQSVNFQNYNKLQAFEESEDKIKSLENDINELPIVEEFRVAQFEANNFLQTMIETMENRLNEHHRDDEEKG